MKYDASEYLDVEMPHAEQCADSSAEARLSVDLLVVDAGEASKSIATAEALWEKLLEVGTDRKSVVVAAGGVEVFLGPLEGLETRPLAVASVPSQSPHRVGANALTIARRHFRFRRFVNQLSNWRRSNPVRASSSDCAWGKGDGGKAVAKRPSRTFCSEEG